jgi:hypothetical protein
MENADLSSVGIACGFRGLNNFTDGVVCYMDFGFTEACATTWAYNNMSTRTECLNCFGHAFNELPNNLAPPTCDLAGCIQCDEDTAGPLFQDFAGRTRRRAGLLTAIVRNCTDIFRLVHRDPCDDPLTSSPSDTPTMAPTDGSSSSLAMVPFLLSSTFLPTVLYLFA